MRRQAPNIVPKEVEKRRKIWDKAYYNKHRVSERKYGYMDG